jgi:hypothetical protein
MVLLCLHEGLRVEVERGLLAQAQVAWELAELVLALVRWLLCAEYHAARALEKLWLKVFVVVPRLPNGVGVAVGSMVGAIGRVDRAGPDTQRKRLDQKTRQETAFKLIVEPAPKR